MKKRYTKREQQEHLENWEEGGMSKNAYAIASGISPRTFIGWTWRTEKPTKKKQNFVEIKKAMLVDPPGIWSLKEAISQSDFLLPLE